jgi:hypothetical protein
MGTDQPANGNGKLYFVASLGGTQTGVLAHTTSSPFNVHFMRPTKLAILPKPNANGIIGSFPTNVYRTRIRKGVLVDSNSPSQLAYVDINIGIPAGADTFDPVSLSSMLSLAIAALTEQREGLRTLSLTGTM